jgi:hypothetical protein
MNLAAYRWTVTLAALCAMNGLPVISALAAPPPPTATVRLTFEFEAVFQPGIWNGWALGSAASTAGYIVEVTPLSNPTAGYFTHAIQQEFDDIGASGWRDVARIQFNGTSAVTANVRIYSVSPK